MNETDIHSDRLTSIKDDLTIDVGKFGMFNISFHLKPKLNTMVLEYSVLLKEKMV